MRTLKVYIEINGVQELTGTITGNDRSDACFSYIDEYRNSGYGRPLSVSLPFQEEAFSPQKTASFFEGLLPEGFTRRSVAGWLHADENDYLTILAGLGLECLGAIRIVPEGSQLPGTGYELMSLKQVKAIAAEGAVRSAEIVTKTHLSLTGASGKVGLMYDAGNNRWYMPCGDAPSNYILKQSHVRLDSIVVNEQLCMMTASRLGISVPDSFVVNTGKGLDGDILLATKRYDRWDREEAETIDGIKVPGRLHQEDFSQALGIPASGKYENEKEGYLHRIFDLLRRYSSDPVRDQQELWRRVVFNYLVGNTDGHIKNYSLIYSPDLKRVRLAPAYDIVSTAIYESSTRDMSFYIGDRCRIDDIRKQDFESAAREAGLGRRMAMLVFDRMCGSFGSALEEASSELASRGFEQTESLKSRILADGGIKNYIK